MSLFRQPTSPHAPAALATPACGELNLAVAVLQRAISDIAAHDPLVPMPASGHEATLWRAARTNCRDARVWLSSREDTHVHSYAHICELLGIDQDRARGLVEAEAVRRREVKGGCA